MTDWQARRSAMSYAAGTTLVYALLAETVGVGAVMSGLAGPTAAGWLTRHLWWFNLGNVGLLLAWLVLAGSLKLRGAAPPLFCLCRSTAELVARERRQLGALLAVLHRFETPASGQQQQDLAVVRWHLELATRLGVPTGLRPDELPEPDPLPRLLALARRRWLVTADVAGAPVLTWAGEAYLAREAGPETALGTQLATLAALLPRNPDRLELYVDVARGMTDPHRIDLSRFSEQLHRAPDYVHRGGIRANLERLARELVRPAARAGHRGRA